MCECTCKKITWLYIWAGLTLVIWMAYIILRAAVFPGTCPAIVEQPSFERTKYAGRWYEFAQSESVP